MITGKKIILVASLLITYVSASYSQVENLSNFDEKEWHWGYYLGVNSYSFAINPTFGGMTDDQILGVNYENTTGFSVGLIGDLKLSDYINLRLEPGLNYTSRKLIYDRNILDRYYNDGYPQTPNFNDSIREVHSTYVNIPLMLKVGGLRVKNIRPYLIGGVTLSMDLASQEGSKSDNTTGIEGFRMKSSNFLWEAGAGIDWYLPYFKLSTEIRGAFSINNEMIKDGNPPGEIDTPWTGAIEDLKSRAIFLVLKFE